MVVELYRKTSAGTGFLLFLIGAFSQTQVRLVGKIGIAEFFMVIVAPFVLFRHSKEFKVGGMMPILTFALLWLFGASVSDMYNHTYLAQALKGIAVPVVVFASLVCIYALLARNIDNLKWLLLGVAVSTVLSTFVLQRGGAGDYAAATGDLAHAAESVMEYKLYWVTMAMAWLSLPITGWYFKTPIVYSLIASFALAVISLKAGGRSLFAVNLLSFVLILYSCKNEKRMSGIRRHMVFFIISLCLLGLAMKHIYAYAAKSGYLGEYERYKYYIQTEHGSNIAQMLISGRTDFFIGLTAALDKPIIGQGSHAMDDKGYMLDIVSRYGDIDEIDRAKKALLTGMVNIKAHSHIINYWMWHGCFALMFWLYVGWLVLGTLFKRMAIYPPYYGYLAMTIPAFMWDYFFSPFSLRVNACILMVVCVIIKKMATQKRRGLRCLN